MFHVVRRVAECQHGSSFMRSIWYPRTTWVCSLAVDENEEANVELLEVTPLVFSHGVAVAIAVAVMPHAITIGLADVAIATHSRRKSVPNVLVYLHIENLLSKL